MDLTTKIKSSMGRPQNDFLFTVHIPHIAALSELSYVPGWGAGTYLTLQVKSTSIPRLERQFKTIRTGRIFPTFVDTDAFMPSNPLNNRFYEFTLPQASTTAHVWNVKIMIDEQFKLYNLLYEWYLALDSQFYIYPQLLTEAYVMLYSGNKAPTKMYRIVDMYPLIVPGIDTLNYDGVDSMVEMELNFAYNYIQYDLPPSTEVMANSIEWLLTK